MKTVAEKERRWLEEMRYISRVKKLILPERRLRDDRKCHMQKRYTHTKTTTTTTTTTRKERGYSRPNENM